ncbi:MAG: ComEC/Rec2 family competence protein [Chitinophagia bacterium]
MYSPPRNFWKPLPFLRMLLPLLFGICLALVPIRIPLTYHLIVIIIVLLIITAWIPIVWKWRIRKIRGWGFVLVCFLLGYLRTTYFLEIPKHTPIPTNKNIELAISLQNTPEPTKSGFQTVGIVEQYHQQGQVYTSSQKVLVWFNKETFPLPARGDILIGRAQLTRIAPALNPGGFDAAAYYSRQQVYFRCRFYSGKYQRFAPKNPSAVFTWMDSVKQFCLRMLRKYINGKNEQAIAEALLIGYKQHLDAELVNAYSDIGIVHIIAISGMHMALLFALLNVCVGKLSRFPMGNWIKLFIQLTSIWVFSWITGASASVLRAACIFSALSLGETLGRKNQPFNSLAGSAVCLLLINPFFIQDAGFLLSYAAVLGILLLAKPLYKCLYTSNPLLNAIWQLNSVTIAAQLFTVPLILYFFHRFPLYFLCTNMIAIPLSGIILYGEILILLLSAFPSVAGIIGTCTEWSIRLMNQWTIATHRLPGASLGGIYLSGIQAILLCAAILLLYAGWYFRKKIYGYVAALALVGFTALYSFRSIQQSDQQYWVIYQLKGKTAIHLISGKQQFLLSDTAQIIEPFLRGFESTAEWYWGAKQYGMPPNMHYQYPIIISKLRILAILRGKDTAAITRLPKQADCILITDNSPFNLATILAQTRCSHFIFDGSNAMWKIREWKKEAERLHLRYYSTPEQGAIIISF